MPVERIGLDHLLKERQLIRSTQQNLAGSEPPRPSLRWRHHRRGGYRLNQTCGAVAPEPAILG